MSSRIRAPLQAAHYGPLAHVNSSDVNHPGSRMYQDCRSDLGHLLFTDVECQLLSCPFATLIFISSHAWRGRRMLERSALDFITWVCRAASSYITAHMTNPCPR